MVSRPTAAWCNRCKSSPNGKWRPTSTRDSFSLSPSCRRTSTGRSSAGGCAIRPPAEPGRCLAKPDSLEAQDEAVDLDRVRVGPLLPAEVRQRVDGRTVKNGAIQVEARAMARAVERFRVLVEGV